MTYEDLLNKVIDNGLAAAREDYAKDPLRLEGAVKGFEVCRGQTPDQLGSLLQSAGELMQTAFRNEAKDYWKHACYHAEIEWVCNCMSVVLDAAIVPPTARAAINVGRIQMEAQHA